MSSWPAGHCNFAAGKLAGGTEVDGRRVQAASIRRRRNGSPRFICFQHTLRVLCLSANAPKLPLPSAVLLLWPYHGVGQLHFFLPFPPSLSNNSCAHPCCRQPQFRLHPSPAAPLSAILPCRSTCCWWPVSPLLPPPAGWTLPRFCW